MPKRRLPHHRPDDILASVHRFRDMAGVYIADDNQTTYLTAAQARTVGEKLIEVATSIESESFITSTIENLTIRRDGNNG